MTYSPQCKHASTVHRALELDSVVWNNSLNTDVPSYSAVVDTLYVHIALTVGQHGMLLTA